MFCFLVGFCFWTICAFIATLVKIKFRVRLDDGFRNGDMRMRMRNSIWFSYFGVGYGNETLKMRISQTQQGMWIYKPILIHIPNPYL